jgi:hypothetical protein
MHIELALHGYSNCSIHVEDGVLHRSWTHGKQFGDFFVPLDQLRATAWIKPRCCSSDNWNAFKVVPAVELADECLLFGILGKRSVSNQGVHGVLKSSLKSFYLSLSSTER